MSYFPRAALRRPVVSPQVIARSYVQKAVSFQAAYGRSVELLRTSSDLSAEQQNALSFSLFRNYRELEVSYAETALKLRGRATELAQVRSEHAKVVCLALNLFPSAQSVRETRQVRGLHNAGGNCSLNSLLQMLFCSPSLIQSLMAAPELKELRKAYLQYAGILEGSINSQAVRAELHALYPNRISARASRWEDSYEVLSLLLSHVPRPVAEESFPSLTECRFYNPAHSRVGDFTGAVSDRSRLTQGVTESGQAYAYALKKDDPSPLLLIDPVADRNGVASFSPCLLRAFEADESQFQSEPGGFLHEGDDTHLYYHQMERFVRVYPTTPEHLVIGIRRFQYNLYGGTRVVSTPMQMPRILTLPPGAVQDGSDGQLLLKAFVVFQPGHYVTYRRHGSEWFYCSDSITRRVSLAEVDNALYHTASGGSYLHYYERADGAAFAAEPPMTQRAVPPVILDTAQTKTLRQLKTLASKLRPSIPQCFAAFSKLDREVQYRCYELLFRNRIQRAGIDQFLANPRSLLPILDDLPDGAGLRLKALLTRPDFDPRLHLQEAFDALVQLPASHQMRCYELLCRDFIIEEGIDEFLRNPSALSRRISVNGRTLSIIDHLISSTTRSVPLNPQSQQEVFGALIDATAAKDKDLIVRFFGMLEPRFQNYACAYAATQRDLHDNLVDAGAALLREDLALGSDLLLFMTSVAAAHSFCQESAASASASASSDDEPAADLQSEQAPAEARPSASATVPPPQTEVFKSLNAALEASDISAVAHNYNLLEPPYREIICRHFASHLTDGDIVQQGRALLQTALTEGDLHQFTIAFSQARMAFRRQSIRSLRDAMTSRPASSEVE